MTHHEHGFAFIKQLAKEQGCNVPDLLALAPNNDPFYVGRPTSLRMAEWFAALWERFDFPRGVHLRRIHYRLCTTGEVHKPDGLPYENTDKDWVFLGEASKYARHLGLVDPTAFVDRRNPEPQLFCVHEPPPEPSCRWSFEEWELPQVDTDLAWNLDWQLPQLSLEGYEYSEALQPFHLEVWVEKSTMEDVLLPLCRQYGVNYVPGIGFMTITSVCDLIQRVIDSTKPARILYLSDFDPAGYAMPTMVARHIEFQLRTSGSTHDIKLQPLALNRAQIDHFSLPRIPVKETDRRKGNFEEQHGEGAVELDALEALHPGALAELVTQQILQYRDGDLADKLRAARWRAEEHLHAAWEKHLLPYRERVERLQERAEETARRYEPQLEQLKEALRTDLAVLQAEMESVRHAIAKEMETMTVSLPGLPEPETPEDEEAWLFDSQRTYLDQVQIFRQRRRALQD